MEIVREHLRNVRVVARDRTAVGFYTRFEVEATGQPVPNTLELRQAFFRGASARVLNAPGELVAFKLWETATDESTITLGCLEGYITSEAWPADETLIAVLEEGAA